jgi:hypothetical protein
MPTTNADITALLDNLVPQQEYAHALGVHQRTVARQRQQGLPFVMLGGKVYIDAKGAKRWVESRVVARESRLRRRT